MWCDPVIREPFDLLLGKIVPISHLPCRFICLGLKELFAEQVRAGVDQQASILGTRVAEVDDALGALQPFAHRRLIDMWPWESSGPVFAVWECNIERVKGDEEVIRAPERGKGGEDPGFHARIPHELLVSYSIGREGVNFTLHREIILCPCLGVINIKVSAETLDPGEGLLLIRSGSVGRDCSFDNSIAVLLEMVKPIEFIGLYAFDEP